MEPLVSEGEIIKFNEPLTSNPSMGGFGQRYASSALRPVMFQGLLLYFANVILAQDFLVLKKKQFEKIRM